MSNLAAVPCSIKSILCNRCHSCVHLPSRRLNICSRLLAAAPCRKQYPVILGCMGDTMHTLDTAIAAAGGPADFDIEHHVLIATNNVIGRGFLKLPEGFIDPEQQARDVSFIMATASRFICEPWRWVGHLYLPFLTAVSPGLTMF